MKKAIVHDWLDTYAGAERCIESFTNLYPNADLYTLVDFLNEKDRKIILKAKYMIASNNKQMKEFKLFLKKNNIRNKFFILHTPNIIIALLLKIYQKLKG